MSDEPWRKYPENSAEVVAYTFLQHTFVRSDAISAWSFLSPSHQARMAEALRSAETVSNPPLPTFALLALHRAHPALLGTRFAIRASERELAGDFAAMRFPHSSGTVLVTLEVEEESAPLRDDLVTDCPWRVAGVVSDDPRSRP